MENIPDSSEEYITALMDGRTAFLTNLARQHGKKIGEYQFFWAKGGLEIFVNDLKFLLIINFSGKLVCSNESMIFVPGDWWKIAAPYREIVESTIKHVKFKEARRAVEMLVSNNTN